jgi:Ferritin-like
MQDNNGDSTRAGGIRRPSTVRIINDIDQPGRREFLRAVAIGGVAATAGGVVLQPAPGLAAASTAAAIVAPGKTASAFVRDFADPYLELIRLLREATEVEHALMLQYLYAAFSLKPEYEELRGHGDPNTTDFFGVAVQEMQHLGLVNRLLVELGAMPNMMPQDMPYEPDIYPFEFALEPMTPQSLAKYVYCEAPAGVFDPAKATTPEDKLFLARMERVLGRVKRPNHVGSFYDVVIDTLGQVEALAASGVALPHTIDFKRWKKALVDLKDEGELGHYVFFREVFMGTHKGFKGRKNVWDLAPTHAHYPSVNVPRNPTAYVGHKGHLADPHALNLAWLGNLHYWTVLSLLTYAYTHNTPKLMDQAKMHMMGPLASLARHLPTIGAAITFDQLSMGYSMGTDPACSRFMFSRLLAETIAMEKRLEGRLPADYALTVAADTLAEVRNT